MFAREAFQVERPSAGGTISDIAFLTHRALVVSAITSSAAALEAMINETFADAGESVGGRVGSLSEDAQRKMDTLWSIPRTKSYAILDKFDIGHLLVTGHGLDRSHHRWRNATWIVKLRNTFVHFEPSWQEHGASSMSAQESSAKVERALKGLFPEQCVHQL
jgi:hypothetical protein